MEREHEIDISELKDSVSTVEMLTIYFPMLRKTLLVDNRFSAVDPPMVRIVPMVRNLEERVRELQKLRPRFPKPESLSIVPWVGRIASLQRHGIIDHMQRHFVDNGWPDAARACRQAYVELERLEREHIRNAVLGGSNFETIWAADPETV
jgi:hypothetical protein